MLFSSFPYMNSALKSEERMSASNCSYTASPMSVSLSSLSFRQSSGEFGLTVGYLEGLGWDAAFVLVCLFFAPPLLAFLAACVPARCGKGKCAQRTAPWVLTTLLLALLALAGYAVSVETTTVQPALNTTFGTVQALENMLDDTSLSVDQVIRIENDAQLRLAALSKNASNWCPPASKTQESDFHAAQTTADSLALPSYLDTTNLAFLLMMGVAICPVLGLALALSNRRRRCEASTATVLSVMCFSLLATACIAACFALADFCKYPDAGVVALAKSANVGNQALDIVEFYSMCIPSSSTNAIVAQLKQGKKDLDQIAVLLGSLKEVCPAAAMQNDNYAALTTDFNALRFVFDSSLYIYSDCASLKPFYCDAVHSVCSPVLHSLFSLFSLATAAVALLAIVWVFRVVFWKPPVKSPSPPAPPPSYMYAASFQPNDLNTRLLPVNHSSTAAATGNDMN